MTVRITFLGAAGTVTGSKYLVDGGSGRVLVDGHDPVDWARALGGLLPDRARRAELAAGATRHARNFSWDRTVSGLLAVYGEAIAEHRARLASELAGDSALSCSW